MYSDKLTQSIAKAATQVMDEQLKGDQHKIDKNKNGKVDAHDFKLLRKEKGLEEGRVGQVSADLTDLSHAEFQKEYGKPKSHFDPTNFKKPVQPGKEMDRAKALAQRGMASMKKEEVEDLSEASYLVKHDGVSDDSKDLDAKKLFAGKTNVNSHMTKYASSAEKHADMLKSKGFKNVRIQTMNKEEVEEVEELDEDKLALRGLYAPGAPMNDKRGGTGAYSYGVKPRQKTIDKRSQELKDVIKDTLGKHGPKGKLPEEVEQMDEMFPGTPEYEKKYGKAPQDMKPGEKKKTTKGEMEKTGKGVVHRRKFSEMLEVYGDDGIKGLFEALQDKEELIEEPTNDEFTTELKDATDKSLGKKRAKVGDASVQSVEMQKEETHSSVSVIDYNDVNGVKFSEIDLSERELNDDEKEDREKNVKGMKKSMEGFKERYGKDAKSVMYATATRMAKEK